MHVRAANHTHVYGLTAAVSWYWVPTHLSLSMRGSRAVIWWLSPVTNCHSCGQEFYEIDSNNSFALFEYTVPLTLGPWACSECLNSLIWSDSSWLKGFEWRASYVSFLSFQFLLTISLRIFRFTHLLLWAQQPQPLLQFALLVLWASLKSFLPLDTKGLGYQNINSGPSHISSVWSYY